MSQAGPLKWILLVAGIAAIAVTAFFVLRHQEAEPAKPSFEPLPPQKEAPMSEVREFCGTACHGYPPPDSFPKSKWRKEVELGYYFAEHFRPDLKVPDRESVIAHFENNAPAELAAPVRVDETTPAKISWKTRGCPIPNREPFPEIVNVIPGRLTPNGKVQLIACECDPLKNEGRILACNPQDDPPTWKTLANVPAPAHAEVADLDGDGHPDIIVACLGAFFPTDQKVGSVVWLRGKGDGTFESITLLKGIGRVADAQAADFNGDGKLDLVVAEFGWREVGSILLLENKTTDWARPEFASRTVDDRHGAVNVPVADLNGDGKPDFVVMLSQEHETIVAFLNDGKGNFRRETIHTAPHPAFGSSGIQLVDMDGDGDADVLYTNGDVLDKLSTVKPYHGIQWLENKGTFPFTLHRLGDMPGVMRAVAADFDGDGDMDVLAVSYLPLEEFPERERMNLDSVLWLEQKEKGRFVRRPLEFQSCDHLTCAAVRLDDKSLPSLVVGNFWSTKRRPIKDALTIWSPTAAGPVTGK